jgi:adenylylsulfate kinase
MDACNAPESNLDVFVARTEKERLLGQRGKVIWMTGLSGSGKTTIAIDFEKELHRLGFKTKVFDADFVRAGINKDLSFSIDDRTENIRRVAAISRLFLDAGMVVINCFISPTRRIREMARRIVGAADFLEVYIHAPFEVCETRDPKGLYQKARSGQLAAFTGIDSPWEAPAAPDLVISTHECTVQEAVRKLLDFVLPKISLK